MQFSGPGSTPSTNHIYLNSSTSLNKWKTALAKVTAGTANARILMLGDSTTLGANSAGTSTWPNGGRQLAKLLNSSGIYAHDNGFLGASVGSTSTGSRNPIDSRIAVGSWVSTGVTTIGGKIYQRSTSAGTSLTFTPTVNCDRFRVWNARNTGNGTATFTAGAGTPTAVDMSTPAVTLTSNIISAASLTSNVLSCAWTSGGTVYVVGIEAYDSTQSQVIVTNAGYWGTQTSTWVDASAFYSPLNGLTAFAPDLLILKPGINDWGSSVTLSTFSANVQTLITTAKNAGGDVVLVSPAPNNTNTALQATYIPEMKKLAEDNNIVFVDLWTKWGETYTSANNQGLMSDSLHPNSVGNSDEGRTLLKAILYP